MLKKAAAVAIAATGLMMLGSPAFAIPSTGMDSDFGWRNGYDDFGLKADESEMTDQLGLGNFDSDSDVLSGLSLVCNVDVNVLAIPILQGNDGPQLCVNSDDDGDD